LTEQTAHKLKILFCTAEVAPFAKTGGLADVAGSLPKAIARLGHDIRVITPRYGRVDPARFGLRPVLEELQVPMDETFEPVKIYEGRLGDLVPVYFVDSQKYFLREGIYGYPDDGERFILFSRAALEFVKHIGWAPDIIHCNDWHTAIIPNWLKTIYAEDPFFQKTATVYTIHNLAYQGIFGWRILEIAGIDEYGFLYPEIAELANVVDLMARGILFADVITTVSERYAQEILTPEYGEKLDPILRDRKDRLFGILNGIDTEELNPATDPYLAANFDVSSLDRRVENKLDLQRKANMPPNPDVPLLGMISRLTDQKGFDLVGQVIDPLLRLFDVQFVLLGTGDPHYHAMFRRVAEEYPDKTGIFLTFNAELAQKIYGGSDMFLMPSRFEPCGLGQMIAMRYGSVPVVRETGGLADTVKDFDPRTGEGNGFTFKQYDPWAFFGAIIRAVETWKHRDVWRKLQIRGMTQDFSWDRSARKYIEVYFKALEFRAAETVGGSRP